MLWQRINSFIQISCSGIWSPAYHRRSELLLLPVKSLVSMPLNLSPPVFNGLLSLSFFTSPLPLSDHCLSLALIYLESSAHTSHSPTAWVISSLAKKRSFLSHFSCMSFFILLQPSSQLSHAVRIHFNRYIFHLTNSFSIHDLWVSYSSDAVYYYFISIMQISVFPNQLLNVNSHYYGWSWWLTMWSSLYWLYSTTSVFTPGGILSTPYLHEQKLKEDAITKLHPEIISIKYYSAQQ